MGLSAMRLVDVWAVRLVGDLEMRLMGVVKPSFSPPLLGNNVMILRAIVAALSPC